MVGEKDDDVDHREDYFEPISPDRTSVHQEGPYSDEGEVEEDQPEDVEDDDEGVDVEEEEEDEEDDDGQTVESIPEDEEDEEDDDDDDEEGDEEEECEGKQNIKTEMTQSEPHVRTLLDHSKLDSAECVK